MGCNHNFNTIDNAFGLATWLYLGLVFYVFGMFFAWRPKWYTVIREYTYWILPERVYIVLTFVLTELNAYAAWRIWVCDNWDAGFIALFMAVMVMLFMNFYPFVMMITKFASVYIIVALAYLAFSIVFSVFAFRADVTAGIITIFDLLLGLVYFFFSLYAWTKEDHLHGKFGERIIARDPVSLNLPTPRIVTDTRSTALESFGVTPINYYGNNNNGGLDIDYSSDDD